MHAQPHTRTHYEFEIQFVGTIKICVFCFVQLSRFVCCTLHTYGYAMRYLWPSGVSDPFSHLSALPTQNKKSTGNGLGSWSDWLNAYPECISANTISDTFHLVVWHVV